MIKRRFSYIFNDKGFTLIELLVIIVISSIILSLCTLNEKSLGADQLLLVEANKIMQDIRYTQQLTVTTRKKHYFELHQQQNYYQIRTARAIGGTVKKVELQSGIKIFYCNFKQSGDYRVLEFDYSSSMPAQTGRIELIDKYGNKKVLTVAVGSGRVVIK